MDPNLCWCELQNALEKGSYEHVVDNAEALIEWLEADGFAPLMATVFGSRGVLVFHLKQIIKAARST